MNYPADIVNRALDGVGRSDIVIGEMQEGTEGAKVALRAYGPAMRQLLRASHWGFARKQTALNLLGDATGQTPNVGTLVQAPWLYCYEQPIDCMKVRFLPWNSNPTQPSPPQTTGSQPALNAYRLIPAPFLVALDSNYPVVVGQPPTWADIPEWWGTAGEGPVQRTVINTNVPPQPQADGSIIYPSLVYTALVIYPSQWDSLFTEALVQLLVVRLAMPLSLDKKFGLQLRNEAIKSVKEMITEARAINSNESGAPQTIAHVPDFIRIRNSGAGNYSNNGQFGSGYNGPGFLYGGWDSLAFGDGGSVF